MESFRPIINPALLTWARTSARKSLDELSKACDTNQEIIADWEAGLSFPTMAQLVILAKQCKRPVAVFFLPKPPEEKAIPPELRSLGSKGPDSFTSETAFILRTALQSQDISKDIFRELDEPPRLQLPVFRAQDTPEALGRQFREQFDISLNQQLKWGNPSVALREWRKHIEALGILTLQMKFPINEGRGFSLYDAEAPIIVLNSEDAYTARCFTLFHELAHLSCRKSGVFIANRLYGKLNMQEREDEFFCNRFAAAILVPSYIESIERKLAYCVTDGTVDEAAIIQVAHELKVSRYVILRKLWSENFISLSTLQTIDSDWQEEYAGTPPNKKGNTIIPPHVKCLSQRGRRFVGMVLEGIDRHIISTMEASEYLGLKTKHFSKLRESVGGYDL